MAVSVQLYCNKCDSSYMFRLRKAAIIMLCISHLYRSQLYILGLTYCYKMLMDKMSASRKVYRQVTFYAKIRHLKNAAQNEHKIPAQNSVFPGVRGVTASSYIVNDYITSRHTDL